MRNRLFFLVLAVFSAGIENLAAQDIPSDMETTLSGRPTTRRLWCAAPSFGSKQFFISEPVATTMQGHLPLWNTGNRFLAVVNARYTLTLEGAEHACRLSLDQAHAMKSIDQLRTQAHKDGLQVITIGSY